MNIVVNEELKAYIDPLTPEEYEALERSLLAEGCRDALVLWGDVLVDGHNRYAICTQHGLPFQTVQNPRFQSLEDVQLWMIDQHLGRRSVSDFQRGVLALRKRQIVAERQARQRAGALRPAESSAEPTAGEAAPWDDDPSLPPAGVAAAAASAAADAATPVHAAPKLAEPAPLDSREALAKAARLSASQVVMIEKIQKQAAPELVAAVRSGVISINAAAAVATLPAEEQVAAATAGKDELRQAAKRVREAKRKPRAESAADAATEGAEPQTDADLLAALRERIVELTAENEALRQEVAALKAEKATGA
ncbi:MAG TPA: plasmid replication/partition related protein [Burkholderiaceae bacterium]|nr:plasmid replication/partition related protein [Burkholderiaceae bacterium]HNG81467.1 plasmid replication/partition related protein [Burkholderiaceae bacterium]